MRFTETELSGVFVVDLEPHKDDRGFFARSFCSEEFAARGLCSTYPQANVSWNARRGTLRGMHYQREPFGEPKIVRVTRGKIYDVALDLRESSATFRRWTAVELSAGDPRVRRALYLPKGIAHGFQTLEDDSEVEYWMGERYMPESAAGVRWNDPAFAIDWPVESPILSDRDASFADFLPGSLYVSE